MYPAMGQAGMMQSQQSLQSLISQSQNMGLLDQYGQPMTGQISQPPVPQMTPMTRSHLLVQQTKLQGAGSQSSIGTAGSLTSTGSARSLETQRSVYSNIFIRKYVFFSGALIT